MLHYLINSLGDLVLSQSATRPVIYLDHWALRKFSEDATLSFDLVELIKKSGSTLALSWLNIAEFSKLESPNAHVLAETFLNKVLPNVFCMEINPTTVIDGEDSHLLGKQILPPHADVELMKLIGGFLPTDFQQLTMCGLFSGVHQSRIDSHMSRLTDSMLEKIETLRDQMAFEPKLRRAVKALPVESQYPLGTRQLLRELIGTLLVDRQLTLTSQHAVDLMHAVVPLAYCDYVLLDGHWEEQVSRVRRRLAKANLTFPVAKVFSERRQGIKAFLSSLGNDG